MRSDLRVAVFSDVHGNFAALSAVLQAIEDTGPYTCTIADGDHCLNGPDPGLVLDTVMDRCTHVLKGNTDRDIVDNGKSDPDLGQKKRASLEWTRDEIGPDRINTLDRLEFDVHIEAPDGRVLLVVHANPQDLDRHIFPDMPESDVMELLGDVDAAVLAFGHLHIPFHRRVGSTELVNIAACGLPRDGDRRAAWGEFNWSPAAGWQAITHRVEYDYGATVLRILDSGMPYPERRIRDLVAATYD
jgi:predicted phosphodiesterase